MKNTELTPELHKQLKEEGFTHLRKMTSYPTPENMGMGTGYTYKPYDHGPADGIEMFKIDDPFIMAMVNGDVDFVRIYVVIQS